MSKEGGGGGGGHKSRLGGSLIPYIGAGWGWGMI